MLSMRDAIITGGDFRQQITHVHNADSAIHRLQSQVAHAAFHNSAQRIDAPRCHPNTRIAVKQKAHRWIMSRDGTTANASVMWLSGGAGAGKSAIAQSLAEEWSDQGVLLASFFFNRLDSSRNHVGALVPTLVAQIYRALPQPTRDMILQAIDDDPLVWSNDIFTQFEGLVAKPLYGLTRSGFFQNVSSPRVLIIDGLDECLDRTMHGKVLQMVHMALCEWHLPFLFIITSRPEPDIVSGFESAAGVLPYFHVNLSNDYLARIDIELFLRDKFEECRKNHPFRRYIPSNWPSDSAIESLVRKSSGHFIYASVTVQYVTSSRHHPHRRLEIILNLRPASSSADTPFSELDALYSQILSSVEDFPLVRRILGLHILTNLFSVAEIEAILALEDGDIFMALSDMTSLISIDGNSSHRRLRLLHASFQDYLFESSRSGEYHINASQSYHEIIVAVLSCLGQWLPDDKNSIIASACYALKKCFRKVTIDSSLSQFMCSGFSLLLVYSNIAHHLASTAQIGRVILYNRMLATVSHILAVLDASTSPFAQHISQKLREDFDKILAELLDKLPNNNRLKLNIATISRSTFLVYRVGGSLCLDEHFLDMTPPRTNVGALPDFPKFSLRTSDEHPEYFHELRRFFTNPSRNSKYAVCPDTLSGAAMFCIEYLRYAREEYPTRTSLPKWSAGVSILRKSCPYKWRRKSNFVVYNGRRITPTAPHAVRSYFSSPGVPENNIHRVNWHAEKYRMALVHLTRLLPGARDSPALVEACTHAVFAPMSRNFPRTSRRARIAMQEFLVRWGCLMY